ncbi:galactose-binding domain-containing protein [Acrocarpospora catenulata]|uniref:galactose-binding domain-containing protein n=1 Tax=Acrocarpospora catenulata TaxID=2836182 RepID=UPI002023A279|nr:discoidin domain-containing protein [Acrocarpospora catenulata]
MRMPHGPLRLVATLVAAGLLAVGPVVPASAAGGPNLSSGKATLASSSVAGHAVSAINDGDQNSYWESTNNSFPQWARIDLGAATSVDQIVLKVPPPTTWQTRTQTLSVQGSADGTNFATVVPSANYTFDPATGNTVTINFAAAGHRYWRVNVTANTGWPAAQLAEFEIYGADGSPNGANLAAGKAMSSSSVAQSYVAGNANDGNQGTYWESVNNVFPQWLQVDLGAATQIGRVVLKLPASGWATRTQTLAVQGSANGSTFTDLVGSAGYVFNPANGNTVTINFAAVSTRYVRLNITANTGWAAGQISEFEVYAPQGGDNQPPTAPGNLAFTEQTPGQVRLTWTASTDNVGVVGYDIYADNQLRASVGNLTTYTDTQPVSATVTYFVRAKDAAGNASANSNSVTRQGQGGDNQPPTAPGNLAFTQPGGGQIRLTWTASTDNIGVTGYDIYANNALRASVAGNILTYTDTQPGNLTVTYFVRAKDAAGNESANSNSVTRTGTGDPETNLAIGKEMVESGHVHTFVAANANDNNLSTYWEGNSGAFPNTLTVKLGANAVVSSVVLKLNPGTEWGTRTQNIQILGREQSATGYTNLVSAANYTFNPATGNSVTVTFNATVADVQLKFNSNTGAPGGQVAEFQVFGVPAPNPDLTVTNLSWTPTSPNETNAITLSATVRNSGSAAAPADSVTFYLGGALVGTADIPALPVGGTATVTSDVGTRAMGSYQVSARVDADNTVFEMNENNNTLTAATPLVVAQAPGPDLQVTEITYNPANPAVGAPVTFTVAVNNRGTTASGATTVTRVVVGGTTLNTTTPSIAAGATLQVAITGSWTATAGGATITATADATNTVQETNETNNTLTRSIVVGRGAAVPWEELEAENAGYQGTLLTADPLRTFGHTNFATESSGRQSVRLNNTGQYVEFTSTAQANSIVVRNSIPDAPGGGGMEATISLYINGTFNRKLTLSSRHSWLYGNTDGPEALTNTPQADARRLFDESHALLTQSYPPGTKFRLQRDATDTASFYIIDLIDLEQVAPALSQPPGCVSITQYGAIPNDGLDDTAAIQQAVTDDQNGVISCVWIPPGQWRQEKKILTDDPLNRGQYNQVGIKDVTIRGAGMWHSQLYTLTEPHLAQGSINHPHEGNFGFDIDSNTQISDIAIFGSGTIRGGPGGAEGGVGLNGRFGVNTKIVNVWIEHANVGVWVGRDYDNIPDLWGPADGLEFSGMRIRNTYADGINFTNGTRNSKVFNSSFRTTGDDALAVWANKYVKNPAVDIAHDNQFVNNTIQLPWRANGVAVYGGYGNKIENNLIYDTMNYPGIMLATDHDPLPFSGTTLIANNALHRTGGVFWGEAQKFGAITLFAQGQDITGVTIRDTDIYDSTYDGIQFKSGGGSTPNVAITNVRIDKSNNGAGILAMGGARGSATLTNVTITNSATGNIVRESGTQFVINGG